MVHGAAAGRAARQDKEPEQPATLAQRKSAKGKDTFDLQTWWKGNYSKFPAWGYVLRAVLTNSPNSIPPERVFSILNDTFDDDQKSAKADYKEFSLMKQYNSRGRK